MMQRQADFHYLLSCTKRAMRHACWHFLHSCKLLLFFLLINLPGFSLAMPSTVPQMSLRFEHVGREQGFQHESIQSMLQDQQGFMWFGTQGGLHRYDGTRVIYFRHDPTKPDSLADNWVSALYQDQQRRLWIGTHNGGLHQFDASNENMLRYTRPLGDSRGAGSNQILAIVGALKPSSAEGGLWLATGDGLAYFDIASKTFSSMRHDERDEQSISSDIVTSLSQDQQGNLWVGTAKGLNYLPAGSRKFTRYRLDQNISPEPRHNTIQSLALSQQGALWITTAAGVEVWTDLQAATPSRRRFGPQQGLNPGQVSAVLEDRDGTVWVGSDDGLKRWDGKAEKFQAFRHHPSDRHSLADNRVTALLQDRTGSLWVGTWFGGASHANLRNGGFERLLQLPGEANMLSSDAVSSVTSSSDGAIWIATGNGLNRRDKHTGAITVYTAQAEAANSLSSSRTRVVWPAADGKVWVGTQNGLNLFDPVTAQASYFMNIPADPTSISSSTIHAMSNDAQGNLWVGTDQGVNFLAKGSRPPKAAFRRFTHDPNKPDSLSHTRVTALLFDHRDQLWVASFGGLDKFNPKTGGFEHFRHDPKNPASLSHSRVYALREDSKGDLWVGTASGLNRMYTDQQGKIAFQRYEGALGSDATAAILEDRAGNIWVSSDGGLYRISPDRKTIKKYTAADGLIDGSFTVGAGFRDQDGTLYFGGFHGLTWFQPLTIVDDLQAPSTTITDFLIFNRSIRANKKPDGVELRGPIYEAREIKLSYEHSVFSIEFAALQYFDPAHTRYAYILEGFDHAWVEADASRRFATYTNLEPGQYLFKVKAANKDGPWNDDGANLKITITPPFWMRWWFRISIALLMLGTAYLLYRLRVRHYAQQNILLEQQVQARTREAQGERQRLQDLTDALPLSVFQLREYSDGRREYVYVSANSANVLGVPAEEILANQDARWRTVLADEREQLRSLARNSLGARQSVSFHQRVEFDGRTRWIHTHTVEPQKVDGDWIWNGFWIDETESYKQREELRHAKDEAEAATITKSHFLANMSHEIRTPMNAIIGLSYLAKKTALNAKQRDYIDKIHQAGSSLLGIINDILDFSKIEAGKLDIEEQQFRLEKVIENTTSLLSHSVQEKGIGLQVSIADDVPLLLIGDALRLRQVMTNLLSNAIKFTSRGEVRLLVSFKGFVPQIGGQNATANQLPNLQLQFSIIDSGIGMSQAQLQKLFQAFTQADSSTTRKYGGTGLGLTISKHLVELMGGKIWVESSEGVGSSFHFTASFGQVQEQNQAATRGQNRPAYLPHLVDATPTQAMQLLKGMRVLLVEDNFINQQIAVELMEQVGIQVTVADNGLHALELLRQNVNFEAILMDLQMPEMDGFAATSAIRAQEHLRHLPIIAMTAHAMTTERQRCLDAGMVDHLSKPIDPDSLYSALARWASAVPNSAANPSPPSAQNTVPDSLNSPPNLASSAQVSANQELHIAGVDTHNALRRCGNNLPLYQNLLARFCQAQASSMAQLAQHLQDQQGVLAERAVHSLRGVAGNIGAQSIADLADTLEQAIHQAATETALSEPAMLELLAQLSAEYAQTVSAIQGVLNNANAVPPSQELLHRLLSYLQQGDAEAVDYFNANQAQLMAMLGKHGDEIALAINSFEFDAASALLKARQKMQEETEQL